jgi:hypothetical protein
MPDLARYVVSHNSVSEAAQNDYVTTSGSHLHTDDDASWEGDVNPTGRAEQLALSVGTLYVRISVGAQCGMHRGLQLRCAFGQHSRTDKLSIWGHKKGGEIA